VETLATDAKKFNNQESEPTEEQIRELEEILKAKGIDREQIWITKGRKPIKVQELIEKNKRYAQALLLKNRHLY
jgi:dihydropteroate synthase